MNETEKLNSNQTIKIENPENQNLEEFKHVQGFTLQQIAEFMQWLGLKTGMPNTMRFISVHYDAGKTGRVLVLLGEKGMHFRAAIKQDYKVENERLAIEEIKTNDIDGISSISRKNVFGTEFKKFIPDLSKSILSEQEKELAPEFFFNLIIHTTAGPYTVPGLNYNDAMFYRALVWDWICDTK